MPTQQDITIGAANEGNGDTLFDAFTKIQANFDELFDDEAAGEVSSVTAGNGLTGTATTGAITINAVGGDGITANADELEVAVDDSTIELSATNGSGTVRIKDNGVTHAKLENRYTAKATSSSTGSQNLDASTATTFLLTGNVATATLTIQNMKLGQVIDIILSGTLSSAVITLADDFTTSTINKVGSTSLDQSATNVIQVVCVDDTDSAAILLYSINTYASDTTP